MNTEVKALKKMLGIEPSRVRKGYAKFDVSNPPLNFTLNEGPFGERGGLSHIRLNPLLRGWGEYYKRAHVRRLFHRLDARIPAIDLVASL